MSSYEELSCEDGVFSEEVVGQLVSRLQEMEERISALETQIREERKGHGQREEGRGQREEGRGQREEEGKWKEAVLQKIKVFLTNTTPL